MTTKEQFEKFVKSEYGSDANLKLEPYETSIVYKNDEIDAMWTAWQACQDLNNAERESLIAQNAMTREALEKANHKVIEYRDSQRIAMQALFNKTDLKEIDGVLAAIKQALSAKPRLVFAGTVNLIDQVVFTIEVGNKLKPGEKVYTIQKGPTA